MAPAAPTAGKVMSSPPPGTPSGPWSTPMSTSCTPLKGMSLPPALPPNAGSYRPLLLASRYTRPEISPTTLNLLSVALAALALDTAPSAVTSPALRVFTEGRLFALTTSNCTVQLANSANSAPDKVTEVAPGRGLSTAAPVQVVLAFAGLFTFKLAGSKLSNAATPVSTLLLRFCTTMLTRDVPPSPLTTAGLKLLLTPSTGLTVNWATASAAAANVTGPAPLSTVPCTLAASKVLV